MDNEIVKEFLVESFDTLDELDQKLIELEQDPHNTELLGSIFRHVHTIKGTCGFLGFSNLEGVTHIGENLLSKVRDGKAEMTSDITSVILELIDAMREMLTLIESTGADGENEFPNLKKKLASFVEAASATQVEPTKEDDKVNREQRGQTYSDKIQPIIDTLNSYKDKFDNFIKNYVDNSKLSELIEEALNFKKISEGCQQLQLDFLAEKSAEYLALLKEKSCSNPDKTSEVFLKFFSASEEILKAIDESGNDGGKDYFDIVTEFQDLANSLELPTESKEEVVETNEENKTKEKVSEVSKEPAVTSKVSAPAPKVDKTVSVAESSLRVDVELLDRLMNLVGELVLVRNQMVQHSNQQQGDMAISNTVQRLRFVTTELQEAVMKTRMQPIVNVWNKFPRVVRDLAKQCDKKIRIEMEGKETELDKTIIESIKDPLTHMVRNSVDHGIEDPDERVKAGKDEEGVMTLRAFHEGGQVIIEIEDDGRGIDTEKLKEKVLQKGLMSPERLENLTDNEALKLIFLPGFSTAEKVTNVSGRGVGMDVVKTNIEKIGGIVDMRSTLGQGTTMVLKIPLTLAIIPALMVGAGDFVFAISQVSVEDLIRLQGSDIAKSVESIQEKMFFRLRGNLIPVVSLNELLGLGGPAAEFLQDLSKKEPSEIDEYSINVVVLKADQKRFGLIVDEISDSEEIVVKPLGRHFKNLPTYAGATILGDGRVALILDVLALADRANIVTTGKVDKDIDADLSSEEKQTVLIFKIGDDEHMAIPLSLVDRLEEFSSDLIEKAGNSKVTQYRGGILPLIELPQYFGNSVEYDSAVPVIVYSKDNHSVGLMVKEITDIVEFIVNPEKNVTREGVMHSAIINDRVTEFIDVQGIVEQVNPRFLKSN